MEKRNIIDQLAQDKLKNLEIEAPELIWNNIERELKKDKNRKILPVWWKYFGAAALLLFGIFIGKEFFSNSNAKIINQKNVVVNTKNKIQDSSSIKTKIASADKSSDENKNKVIVKNSNEIVVVTANEKIVSAKTNNSLISKKSNTKIVSNYKLNKNKNQSEKKYNDNIHKNIKSDDEKIAITDSEKNIAIANEKNQELDNFKKNNEKTVSETAKKIAFDEKITLKKDSIPAKINVLGNLLAEKTNKKTIKIKANKWEITPNFAPIYANATTNNSPIDAKFDKNNKSYDKNIGLGLAINYAVSKKIKIRTGINSFEIGYNTNNIGYYKNVATNASLNDATAIISSNYTISNNSISTIPNPTQAGTSFNPNLNPTKTEGIINQKSSYLEVPLEVSYAIIDKKFGINIITGFSSLLLNKNQVSIISNNNNIDLGQADNLSKIHFSTNIGLGFNYKFAKAFQVNFEPILKYQINTYTNNFNDYRPYFVGIYSGISYKF